MSLPIPNTLNGNNNVNKKNVELPYFEDCEAPLIELAQRSNGDLRKLLTAFFSFLHRRTDLYYIKEPSESESTELSSSQLPSSNIGFKEGEAEQIIIAAFRQFPLRRIPTQPSTSMSSPIQQPTNTSTTSTHASNANATLKSDKAKESRILPPNIESKVQVPSTKGTSSLQASSLENDINMIQYTDEGLQIPIGNGGITSKYRWTQTLDECTVLFSIPNQIRAKDLNVVLQPTKLLVQIKSTAATNNQNNNNIDEEYNNDNQNGILLDGELSQKIVPSESTWTIEGGVMQISLYKHTKTFWDTIYIGDEKIDTSMVDSRRNVHTYDEITQAHIRKILFDQQQISKGLPTSDELTGVVQQSKVIPSLPTGVEYINQDILDSKMKDLGK
jgi:hypothetical protein